MRDPVVTVVAMSPPVTIDEVAHMDELLADDDLQRSGGGLVDPGRVDQNRVGRVLTEEAVGAAVVGGDPPAEPSSVDGSIVRSPKIVRRQ